MGHVGVLGAGIQGCCVALALAARGYRVDLFDKNDSPVTQASLQNEGKIHLGLVYANDPSLRTARLMLEGSLRFSSFLGRWCNLENIHDHLSTPFHYAVHSESGLPPERIAEHFTAVQDLYAEMREGGAPPYLGLPNTRVFEKVMRLDDIFPTGPVAAAYRTIEHSVDPAWIAERLREAVLGHPRIEWHNRTVVESVGRNDDGRIGVVYQRDSSTGSATYDQVVNCLWDGRLKVDETFGVRTSGAWLYRYKAAIVFESNGAENEPASTTIVLGAFGDVVNFARAGKVYVSWYPHCMRAIVAHPPPENWQPDVETLKANGLVRDSLMALAQVHPGVKALADSVVGTANIGGGVICARGRTDITDHVSGLHNRFEIGVESHGNYHSVDTGKYCMAPYFAEQVCRRIAGEV